MNFRFYLFFLYFIQFLCILFDSVLSLFYFRDAACLLSNQSYQRKQKKIIKNANWKFWTMTLQSSWVIVNWYWNLVEKNVEDIVQKMKLKFPAYEKRKYICFQLISIENTIVNLLSIENSLLFSDKQLWWKIDILDLIIEIKKFFLNKKIVMIVRRED